MSETFALSINLNDIVYFALRQHGAYAEGNNPSPEDVSNGIKTLMDIITDIEENDGVPLTHKIWRQRTFTASDVILESTKYYRCIKSYTSPLIATWASGATYALDDKVYPTTYNGFYYLCITAGVAGATEPTFSDVQDGQTADGAVTWEAFPDTKPGVGMNYSTYWVEDSAQTSGSSWDTSSAKDWKSSSDFFLLDDEIFISKARIRYSNEDCNEVEIVGHEEWMSVVSKERTGFPTYLYLDQIDRTHLLARLDCTPQLTGADGYILHYQANLRSAKSEDGDTDVQWSNSWNRALKWMLTAEIASEKGLDMKNRIYFDKKAKAMYESVTKRKKQRVTQRRIVSCYEED
jgi:hypothetical protein